MGQRTATFHVKAVHSLHELAKGSTWEHFRFGFSLLRRLCAAVLPTLTLGGLQITPAVHQLL
jgi:hypothetical protein